MKDIVIIGAGGFAKKVACLIKDINKKEKQWNLLGFIDDNLGNKEKEINDIKVLGDTDDFLKMSDDIYYVIGIGSGEVREKIDKKLSNKKPATLIHPNVILEEFIEIGEGTIICCNNAIAVNSKLGKHCLINFGSTIGHDAILENYVTVCPGVHLSGDTKVGEKTMLGTGSCIIQGLKIGSDSTLGAGTVLIKSIPNHCTVVGNPGKIVKINGERV